MKKTTSLLLSALLISGLSAAQSNTQNTNAQTGPGWIGAGHPLYFLETSVVDPAQQAIGLKSAADIAREKAAEAEQAASTGNVRALQTALQQWNKTRGQIPEAEAEDLPQPSELVNSLKEKTPDQANQGLNTALDSFLNSTARGAQQITESVPVIGGGDQPSEAGSNAPRGRN